MFAHRISIGIAVIVSAVGLVIYLVRRVSDVLLPVLGPVNVFISQLRGRFNVATHDHTINHGPDQRRESEH